MKIDVLGTGCPKCAATEKNVREALAQLGSHAEVHKVTKINEIMEYDVMLTPAVAIDGDVKVSGKVPTVEEIKAFLNS